MAQAGWTAKGLPKGKKSRPGPGVVQRIKTGFAALLSLGVCAGVME